jgi:hypothetical protein
LITFSGFYTTHATYGGQDFTRREEIKKVKIAVAISSNHSRRPFLPRLFPLIKGARGSAGQETPAPHPPPHRRRSPPSTGGTKRTHPTPGRAPHTHPSLRRLHSGFPSPPLPFPPPDPPLSPPPRQGPIHPGGDRGGGIRFAAARKTLRSAATGTPHPAQGSAPLMPPSLRPPADVSAAPSAIPALSCPAPSGSYKAPGQSGTRKGGPSPRRRRVPPQTAAGSSMTKRQDYSRFRKVPYTISLYLFIFILLSFLSLTKKT